MEELINSYGLIYQNLIRSLIMHSWTAFSRFPNSYILRENVFYLPLHHCIIGNMKCPSIYKMLPYLFTRYRIQWEFWLLHRLFWLKYYQKMQISRRYLFGLLCELHLPCAAHKKEVTVHRNTKFILMNKYWGRSRYLNFFIKKFEIWHFDLNWWLKPFLKFIYL
jgi:hypothetical protein